MVFTVPTDMAPDLSESNWSNVRFNDFTYNLYQMPYCYDIKFEFHFLLLIVIYFFSISPKQYTCSSSNPHVSTSGTEQAEDLLEEPWLSIGFSFYIIFDSSY